MDILIICNAFPPVKNSGAVQLRDLCVELVRQGHSVTVFVPEKNLSSRTSIETVNGYTVVRLKSLKLGTDSHFKRVVSEFLMPFSMILSLRGSSFLKRKWDGIIWYSPSIFHLPLVKYIKNKNFCSTYLILRDIFPDWAADLGLMRRGLVFYFLKYFAVRQYRYADTVGVQSFSNVDYIKKFISVDSFTKIEVLPNWLGIQKVKPCSISLKETCLAGRRLIVYSGNMGVAQDMDMVIRLAERFSNETSIGFLLVGRGSEVRRLKLEVERLNLKNILFCDEVDPDEMADLYSQCCIGLVALHRRHRITNVPGKFLGYIQSGLPVLALLNEGNDLSEVIRKEGIGEVCDSYDLDELHEKCNSLLHMIETDSEVSNRCKKVFQYHFSSKSVAEQITNSLRSVCS